MAPTVLGIGIPASSPAVPEDKRAGLQKLLDFMDSDMNSSAYDWEMFYFTPQMDYSLLGAKLKEKQWDVVMVGVGLRTTPPLIPFFEKIVNTVHEESPKSKFAFNVSIEATQEACKRVYPV